MSPNRTNRYQANELFNVQADTTEMQVMCLLMTKLFFLGVFFLADPVEELSDASAQTSTNSAAELLKQGAGTAFLQMLLQYYPFHIHYNNCK